MEAAASQHLGSQTVHARPRKLPFGTEDAWVPARTEVLGAGAVAPASGWSWTHDASRLFRPAHADPKVVHAVQEGRIPTGQRAAAGLETNSINDELAGNGVFQEDTTPVRRSAWLACCLGLGEVHTGLAPGGSSLAAAMPPAGLLSAAGLSVRHWLAPVVAPARMSLLPHTLSPP